MNGEAIAPTAEALMRSRYTAFCEGAVGYLFETHHAESRSADERAQLERSVARTEWTNLLILDVRKGGRNDATGVVEFAAAFRPRQLNVLTGSGGGVTEIQQLHERSRFLRDGIRWVYVDGDQLPPHQTKRGVLCWCGSGKKTKQCHG